MLLDGKGGKAPAAGEGQRVDKGPETEVTVASVWFSHFTNELEPFTGGEIKPY